MWKRSALTMLSWCALSLSLSGCVGEVSKRDDPRQDPSNNLSPTNNAPNNSTNNPNNNSTNNSTNNAQNNRPDPREPGPEDVERSGMRRLTKAQYTRAVRALLGPQTKLPDELEADPVPEGAFVFSTTLARQTATDDAGVDRYARAADQIARQVFWDAQARQDLLGCQVTSAQDPCLIDFMRRTMRRAWSRPVTQAELDRAMALIARGQQTLDLWTGVSFAVAAILESPHFLYRAHLGEADAQPGKSRFTNYEMADRLALLLWGSLPDDELLEAADQALLVTTEGLRAQAQRMLRDERAEQGVMAFLQEWFGLDGLEALSKDEDIFPRMSHTLGPAMRRELETLLAKRVLEEDQDLLELLTSRRVFINDELRQVYGITEPVMGGAWEWRELPETWDRGGFLTTPGVMALNATRTRTSPTLRGLYILERLLCLHINPAPDGLNVDDFLAPEGQETVREWNARFRQNSQCASCHNIMDPIGLAFERFSGLGQHRGVERGMPIQTDGALLGQRFTDAKDLGRLLRESPQVHQCVVRQVLRYANGQHEVRSEEPLVTALTESFAAQDFRLKPLLLEFILSDAFRKTKR